MSSDYLKYRQIFNEVTGIWLVGKDPEIDSMYYKFETAHIKMKEKLEKDIEYLYNIYDMNLYVLKEDLKESFQNYIKNNEVI